MACVFDIVDLFSDYSLTLERGRVHVRSRTRENISCLGEVGYPLRGLP